jgi:putative membrane protein
MLPALTGLFALSGLIWSLFTLENSGDKNDHKDKEINYSEIPGPSIRGGLAGFIVGVLPGLGGANAATFLLLIENWLGKKTNRNRENRSYLITTSSLNTTEAMISIITLYLISKPRSGASIAIGSVLNNTIEENHVQIIITAMIVSGIVSAALIWKIGPIIAKRIHLYDYGALNWSLIVFLSILIGLLSGLGGLTVLCCAFSIGILPFVLDVRKGQLMGFFLLPVLIYYSGEGRVIYDTLLLTQRHSAILSFPSSNYIFISIFISIIFGFLSYKYFLKNKISIKKHQYFASKLIYTIPVIGIIFLLYHLL